MKRLRFPNDNTLILLNKGGSSLLGWIIKFYSDSKGIPIRHNEEGEGKKVLVIRNPYQRFISGFLHQWYGNDREILHDFRMYLSKAVRGEIEVDGIVDYHLWRAGSIMDRERIEPDVVIKIEDLEEEMENWGKWNLGAREPDWRVIGEPPFGTETPKLMKELELPYEGWDALFFKGLWLQSKESVKGHHRVERREFLSTLLEGDSRTKRELNKWVEGDMFRWGYKRML